MNANAGAATPIPAELEPLLRRSVQLAEATSGAFDPTWAALWGLWDFRAAEPVVPTEADIAARVALVDWRRLAIADGTARLEEAGMLLGLGGIAKGWALDGAAAALRGRGVTDWVLSAGGQILSDGRNPDGGAWTVGIRDPRGEVTDFFAVLYASGVSVSTSGDYERFFLRNGVRYHHILDPRTGRPARGLRSVTVVCPDATTADALSTALMVMGYLAGSALVRSLPDVEAVWVDDAGGVVMSPGLGDRFTLVHPPREGASGAPSPK